MEQLSVLSFSPSIIVAVQTETAVATLPHDIVSRYGTEATKAFLTGLAFPPTLRATRPVTALTACRGFHAIIGISCYCRSAVMISVVGCHVDITFQRQLFVQWRAFAGITSRTEGTIGVGKEFRQI